MDGGYITATVTGITLASGAASTGTTLPVMSSGERPRFIRIAATAAACIRIGAGAQTALTTDLQIQPGDAVILMVPTGITNIACIAATATAGVVQVSPLENM